jgi:hypothetical protein
MSEKQKKNENYANDEVPLTRDENESEGSEAKRKRDGSNPSSDSASGGRSGYFKRVLRQECKTSETSAGDATLQTHTSEPLSSWDPVVPANSMRHPFHCRNKMYSWAIQFLTRVLADTQPQNIIFDITNRTEKLLCDPGTGLCQWHEFLHEGMEMDEYPDCKSQLCYCRNCPFCGACDPFIED